jgi:very-short-patch-repair endonuclease
MPISKNFSAHFASLTDPRKNNHNKHHKLGDILILTMLDYNKKLKTNARRLRSNSTSAEILLWSRLRRKQLLNVQFYRQKPIGNYIADFYAPQANLVIEVDGGQHFEKNHEEKDKKRDFFMEEQGLKVLRFDNLQVLQSINEVVGVIFRIVDSQLSSRR